MNDATKKKAFALFEALSKEGMGDMEIGTVLLGMAIGALTEGGLDRKLVHELVDATFDEREKALS